ncbi:MAG: hypothetical protein AAGA48_29205 [Myxococcota bacterium]
MDGAVAGLPAWVAPVLVGMSVLSGLGLVGAAVALPRVLAGLPVDYLHTPEVVVTHPTVWLGRALVAIGLAFAGLAMLVLPGQGVLTLLAAALVSPVRGKKHVVRWLLGFDIVFRAVTMLRARRGAPPLRPLVQD